MAVSWSDAENDLLVADYFRMLAADLAGHGYVKAEHRRALIPHLKDRSEGSIEFKHQNVSAVLVGLGEVWIPGYKPAFNMQASLIDAVVRWLSANPGWTARPLQQAAGLAEEAPLFVGAAPMLRNAPPPAEAEAMLAIARHFDVAARDEANRALGRIGEEIALRYEQAFLRSAGRADLADQVHWTSDLDGDGAGYDIASFNPEGGSRLLEVKTTRGWDRTPFHISRNELDVADAKRDEWHLFRIYDVDRRPAAFEIRPPLDVHVELTATSFRASFH